MSVAVLLFVSAVMGLFIVNNAQEMVYHNKHNLNNGAREKQKPRPLHKKPYKIRGFTMHHKAQVSIEEVEYILDLIQKRREALGREPNFLVFGLGFDSDFWRQVTKGEILFLEQFNTPWFPKPCPSDVLAVDYTSTMQESMVASTEELHTIAKRYKIPTRVLATEWDVALVDAPSGVFMNAKRQGKGRVQAMWMALQTLAPDGYIVVDDFERPLEERTSTEFYGPNFYMNEDWRGRKSAHKQAYFQPHANGKGKEMTA